MNQIKFRPLRHVKKSDKIVVASYSTWRKIVNTDRYNPTHEIVVDTEYKGMDPDAFVHNQKGEQLFFPDYARLPSKDVWKKSGGAIGLWVETIGEFVRYGMDSEGVPFFSDITKYYAIRHYKDSRIFNPLTVGTVAQWVDLFLSRIYDSPVTYK